MIIVDDSCTVLEDLLEIPGDVTEDTLFVEINTWLTIVVSTAAVSEDLSKVPNEFTEGNAFVEISESLVIVDDSDHCN